MFSFIRALFFGALGLIVLIPVGIALAAVGLPIVAVMGLVALPVLLVLLLIGLPFLILFAVVVGLLGAVFGVLMAFLSIGVVALKLAMLVLIPLVVLGWIVRRVFGGAVSSDQYLVR